MLRHHAVSKILVTGCCLALAAGLAPAGPAASRSLRMSGVISFEANQGQTPERVKFFARGSGANLFLTEEGAELTLVGSSANAPRADVRMELLGAPNPRLVGEGDTGTRSHYYGGSEPRSVTDVPQYERVRFEEAYRGIDVVFYGGGEGMEYDFVVQPGARPDTIRLRYRGMTAWRLETSGDLVLETAAGPVRHRKPVAYQTQGGKRRLVPCEFRTTATEARVIDVGFGLGTYDASLPLTIDPILDFATYLGGSGGGDEYARGVATSPSGERVYVTGDTSSVDFPGRAGSARGQDVFISCIDFRGRPRWNVFLVGSGDDMGFDVAVDALGQVCVTGSTSSPDFPLWRPFQRRNAGGTRDGFLTVLSPLGGRPLLSTYVGGPDEDGGYSVAFSPTGDLWALFGCGSGLPTTPGAPQRPYGGGSGDAYLMKVQLPGLLLRPRIAYATYIGGSDYDSPAGLAVDRFGDPYAAGNTLSPDFPTTPGVVQPEYAGLEDQWVTKIANRSGRVVYSTYLGGFGNDYLFDLDVVNGEAYLGGANVGGNFPTTPGAFQPNPPGGVHDGTVARVNASGTGLVYSTYVGASGLDAVRGIAVGRNGSAYLGIETDSALFPMMHPIQGTYGGGPMDGAVAVLEPSGSGLSFSTFVGGSGLDRCFYDCIARSRSGAVYFVGQTDSGDFPTLRALQPGYGGGPFDAFVVRLRP